MSRYYLTVYGKAHNQPPSVVGVIRDADPSPDAIQRCLSRFRAISAKVEQDTGVYVTTVGVLRRQLAHTPIPESQIVSKEYS